MQWWLNLTPGVELVIGGLLIAGLPFLSQAVLSILIPMATLAHVWLLPSDTIIRIPFLSYELLPLTVHAYSKIFATVFCIAASGASLFAFGRIRVLELCLAHIYAGFAIMVLFSGDILTFLFNWEMMSLLSMFVVWASTLEGQVKKRSDFRYALWHLFGSLLIIMGALGYATYEKTIGLHGLTLMPIVSTDPRELFKWCLCMGLLLNAGVPLLNSWLMDSYSSTSAFGVVFLAAFTTKASVFALLTFFAGNAYLIDIGLVMIFYGIIYAILENDMRRILAYSVINQVGFMIVGIGIGTTIALHGVASHAFCHIIYKGLLFMAAGSVLYMTNRSKCTELGGLHHTMRITTICAIIGALSISAFPLTSGFVSKSMILTAASDKHLAYVWYLLVAASAGVFLHAGFPWFVFFQKDSGLRPKDPPVFMIAGMILFATLCIFFGVFPQILYALLPEAPGYTPYTGYHVVSQLQLLLFSGLAFFVALPLLQRTDTISLESDWILRVFLRNLWKLYELFCTHLNKYILRGLRIGQYEALQHLNRYYGSQGVFSRNVPIRTTVLLATILLGLFLMVYF